MRFLSHFEAVAIAAIVLLNAHVAAAQGTLADAPGKDIVVKACSARHEIETVISSRRTKLGWRQSVDDMISRGTGGSAEDMEKVVAYLTT